jgi:thiol-disulfide isomerase/thioredoxin
MFSIYSLGLIIKTFFKSFLSIVYCFLENYFMTNSFLITKETLGLLGIPHSRNFLKEVLDCHPEQESLLSISDTFAKYKVDTLAVQIDGDKLDQLPLPCVVQIKGDHHPYFSCLSWVSEDSVEYMNIKGETTKIPRDEFIAIWTGVTLLVEKGENSSEPGYEGRKNEQLIYRSFLILLGIVGIVWIVGISVDWVGTLSHSIGVLSLFTLKLAGLVISAILLWSEVDKNNPAIKEFCTGGKNVDCNTVLESFSFEGMISLSNLAFAYFFSGFFLLMLTSFSGSALQLLSYLSFASLVIVPISLFYQGIKIKKWCLLCLWVSGVLILEFAASQILLANLEPPALIDLSMISFLFLASIIGWLSLKPYLIAKRDINGYKSKLAKFMSNKEVFDYLLSGSRKISTNTEGLGIFLKGQNSKYHVLKVCNPYCGPCARAHPALEQLYEKGNIDLQILFLPGGTDEVKMKTVSPLWELLPKVKQIIQDRPWMIGTSLK